MKREAQSPRRWSAMGIGCGMLELMGGPVRNLWKFIQHYSAQMDGDSDLRNNLHDIIDIYSAVWWQVKDLPRLWVWICSWLVGWIEIWGPNIYVVVDCPKTDFIFEMDINNLRKTTGHFFQPLNFRSFLPLFDPSLIKSINHWEQSWMISCARPSLVVVRRQLKRRAIIDG